MKYKIILGVLFASVLLTTVATAATNEIVTKNVDKDYWTFSFSGGGASDLGGGKLNNSGLQGDFSLGRSGKFVLPLEIGVRQGFGYSDTSGADWKFSTKLYSDWTIMKLGNLEFDAGVNAGLIYGTHKEPTWTAAPEGVFRFYLKKDVDLFGRVEYPFDLNAGRAQESLVYVLGMRIKF